jgi:phosphoglycerate dehydrogenase-like enzyme
VATRRLRPRDADGGWESPLCNRLADLTLGLVGLGCIGARIAKIGHAFGIKMIAWNEKLTTERAAEHGIERVDKAELFSRSDVVSVQRRLSGRIERISRGGLVNEVELIDVLRERRIAGAGLEVFEVGPLPHDSLLRSHFRVFFRTGVVARTRKRR